MGRLYPENSGQDESVGQMISRELNGDTPLLHVLGHDDDVFAYWYWRDGRLLDRCKPREVNRLLQYLGVPHPRPPNVHHRSTSVQVDHLPHTTSKIDEFPPDVGGPAHQL